MSLREMVVLGSSSQVPTRHRNHNGYLLLWDGKGILFDPGEGTQRQMTRYGVRAHQIHRIAITHFHGDHCLGLPGILQRISLDGVPHRVHVHYPHSGDVYFRRLRRASIYVDKADIAAVPQESDGLAGTDDGWTLHTARLDHGGVDAMGFRLQEAPRWKVDPEAARARGVEGRAIGELLRQGELVLPDGTVRIEDVASHVDGQSVAFLMDTRPCPNAHTLAKGVDLLVVESTYLASETREAHDHAHMTAEQAGRMGARAGAGKVLLTHFSQRYPLNAPFAQEAGQHHPDVVAAVDGLRVPIGKRTRD